MQVQEPIIIIGAGPAGLTAAYELAAKGKSVVVLETDPVYVGGIARTVRHEGFCIDVGGHRFFSKSRKIEDFWSRVLGDDFLVRRRKSRILYKHKLFSYPLRPIEALVKLGPAESARCLASYLVAKLRPAPEPLTFAEWVTQRFGRRLFEIFFRTYTEKVWGMSCDRISADWAAQRINNVSPLSALTGRFFSPLESGRVKSLVQSFRYPRKGPGMMWEALAERVRALGGEIRLGAKVIGLRKEPSGDWLVRYETADGPLERRASALISSMPMRELAHCLSPTPRSLPMADALKYRDFIVVALVFKGRELFDDNWIYVHEEGVKVGRIQNFRAASPEMVPDPSYHCYGMEYFCFEHDGLWASPDEALVDLAKAEIVKLGLADASDIVTGHVVRQAKAYPVYDHHYKSMVAAVRAELEHAYPGLYLVGRNGMHKYNNQDHSMMTAMLTAENILAGKLVYDVWQVNQDAQYHEQTDGEPVEPGLRLVPEAVAEYCK